MHFNRKTEEELKRRNNDDKYNQNIFEVNFVQGLDSHNFLFIK